MVKWVGGRGGGWVGACVRACVRECVRECVSERVSERSCTVHESQSQSHPLSYAYKRRRQDVSLQAIGVKFVGFRVRVQKGFQKQ